MSNNLPKETDWEALSDDEILEIWQELSEMQKREVFRNATSKDRKVLEETLSNEELRELGHLSSKIDWQNSSDSIQVSERDQAKFELERIHREKLENEISLIREDLNNYISYSEERQRKRRIENIYILTALGIVGGYFSFNPDLEVSSTFQIVALGFAAAASAFLLIKLITVRLGRFQKESTWSSIDNYADNIFPGLVISVFVLGSVSILISIYTIPLNQISEIGVSFLSLVAGVFTVLRTWAARDDSSPDVTREDIEVLILDTADSSEPNIEQIIDALEDFKSTNPQREDLEELRSKIDAVKGITERDVKNVKSVIDKIIEDVKQEDTTEREEKEEKLAKLEKERELYREIVQEDE
jgi:hypothetical protein